MAEKLEFSGKVTDKYGRLVLPKDVAKEMDLSEGQIIKVELKDCQDVVVSPANNGHGTFMFRLGRKIVDYYDLKDKEVKMKVVG